MKNKNRFIYNAVTLVAVSLIMRSVGLFYNVCLARKIGAEAMGVYSLIGNIYGFGVTLATSGINLAVTRLVSEAIGDRRENEMRRIIRTCLSYALIFSISSALILFLLSDTISLRILDDARCAAPLRILSLSLPPIAITSVFNGYFTARRQIFKNALTVFIEQGVRIFLTMSLLGILMPPGISAACTAMALGSTLAEFSSFVILGGMYCIGTRKSRLSPRARHTRALCSVALPVAFSSYVRSGLLTLEHTLIPAGLKKYGSSPEISLALYGTLHSMAFPVIFFPSVFITSFSGLLIPEVAENRAAGKSERVYSIVRRTMRLTLLFSIGVGGIMLTFASELGHFLYPESNSAGRFIAALAPLVPVMYLDTMVDVMLKGLGEQFYSMVINIADALISVMLVWLVLPHTGIWGYVVIIYITEIFNAAFSLGRLISICRIKFDITNWVIKPAIAVLGAVSIIRLITLPGGIKSGAALTAAIISAAVIYLILLRGLFAVERSDIKAATRTFGITK